MVPNEEKPIPFRGPAAVLTRCYEPMPFRKFARPPGAPRTLAIVSRKACKNEDRGKQKRIFGAADGVRTRDFQNHNLALLPAELQPPQLMSL